VCYDASAPELLQLWKSLLEGRLRHGGSIYVQAQAAAVCCCNNMSPDSCSIRTHIFECPLNSKGPRVLVSAGLFPAETPAQDEVRPGERGTLHKSSSHPEPNSPYVRAKDSPVWQFRPGPCPLQTTGDLPN